MRWSRSRVVGAGLAVALLGLGTVVALRDGDDDDGRVTEAATPVLAASLGPAPDRCYTAYEALPLEPTEAELASARADERGCMEAAVEAGDLDPSALEAYRRQDRRDACAALGSLDDEAACLRRHVDAGELEPFLLGDLAYERCSRLVGEAVTACVADGVAAGLIDAEELATLQCDDIYANLPPDATEVDYAALAPAYADCLAAAGG